MKKIIFGIIVLTMVMSTTVFGYSLKDNGYKHNYITSESDFEIMKEIMLNSGMSESEFKNMIEYMNNRNEYKYNTNYSGYRNNCHN